MVDGQIGFHEQKNVRRRMVTKDNAIVNKLNKTKTWSEPDLAALQEARAAETRREQRDLKKARTKEEQADRRAADEEARVRSYDGLMNNDDLFGDTNADQATGAQAVEDFEDDFM
jgi:hypothetical protein